MSLISFDGLNVPLEEVQENPARYATRLERAKKAPGYAVCGCKGSQHAIPLRLVIRRYGTLFHLARWPDDGARHGENCAFHSDEDPASRRSGDPQDAIRATPDGLNAKLNVSLSVRTVERSTRAEGQHSHHSAGRRSAPLFGFLQRMWLDAGLNLWVGDSQRNWGACNARLLGALGDGKLNGKPIQEVLHVMRRYEESEQAAIKAEFELFLSRIQTTPAASERGIVIAELKSVDQSKYGHVVKIRQTFESFFASKDLIEKTAKSFWHAWPLIGNADARVVALLVIERTKDRNLRVIDIAAQLCSKAFIPCDSSYEVAMANRLVSERRRFAKPMRLEGEDVLLPDFIFSDTRAATVIEVYGMESNKAYRRRKEQKQTLYAQKRTNVVQWVPPAALAAVSFPPAA
ncbi:Protein of unknown function [Burkholderia sp. D7]|nr:Protein of unknown function [Burkholderia sp. D7]